MKTVLALLCGAVLTLAATGSSFGASGLSPAEQHRMKELQERLCAVKQLDCAYVTALFADPRLEIYYPPAPKPTPEKERERNPFLRTRFGLLTPESLERCRGFVDAHTPAFDAAYRQYGVPPEIICGILRIETNFGMATKLSPHPVGTIPAISRLATLYVRPSPREKSLQHFAKEQKFALNELKCLLKAATEFGWDLFQIPGSPTGAIGLAQFEPSSLKDAVDGNGDGKIDLFDPADAIPSVANYLVTRGWDNEPLHQRRAIYAYYGGNYDADPNKFYMRAVLKYADEVSPYLKSHSQQPEVASTPQPF